MIGFARFVLFFVGNFLELAVCFIIIIVLFFLLEFVSLIQLLRSPFKLFFCAIKLIMLESSFLSFVNHGVKRLLLKVKWFSRLWLIVCA